MNQRVPLPQGYCLRHYEAVGSSNDEAKALARSGASAGTLVWADRQIAGRGRRGRLWSSPPGNLYLSLVLRPDAPASRVAQLGFVTALGVGDALAELAPTLAELRFKWPNDILVQGKKLAGILLESETSITDRVDFVVVGVGVNLASAPRDTEYPATALVAEGAAGLAPAALLAGFVRHFDFWLARWRTDGFAPVRAAWLARAAGLGQPIEVRLERASFTGRFADLDADGALVLEAPAEEGGRRIVTAGEVFPARVAA